MTAVGVLVCGASPLWWDLLWGALVLARAACQLSGVGAALERWVGWGGSSGEHQGRAHGVR